MEIIRENNNSEIQLVDKIRRGEEHAFEELFFEYFSELCAFALQMTRSHQQAKDIVQQVFEKIWERRDSLNIKRSLKAYLYKSVRNTALNNIDKRKTRKNMREEFSSQKYQAPREPIKRDGVNSKLVNRIWDIVSEMPQRRQSVFVLHRRHGLSYKEIAKVLEISRKTVENHMGLALKDIRAQLEVKNK